MAFFIVMALLVWGAVVGSLVWGTYLTLAHLRRGGEPHTVSHDLPAVSVLKPLKGMEPGLEVNLESFFHLNYPEFELLFCVSSKDDPAGEVVKRLRAKYPEVRSRLIISETTIGPNPKVNNLYGSYYRAINDHIVISDSNVRVGPDYLYSMLPYLTEEVGVVTSLIAGTGFQGLGGYLEASYLNGPLARLMSLGVWIGMPLVLGKSMCLRRSVAEQFGGLDYLGHYLAEDYMTGHSMRRLGLKVSLSHEPIRQYIGNRRVGAYWSRHVRWGRLRKAHSMSGFLLEPMTGSIIPGLMASWAMHHLTGVSFVFWLAVHFCLWAACNLPLLKRLSGWSLPLVGAWFLREWLAVPLWFHTLFGTSVEWRGQRLQLKPGGRLRIYPASVRKRRRLSGGRSRE